MPNPAVDLQRAIAALRGGQPNIAIVFCDQLLADRPRFVEARHLRGRCWASLGRWAEAVADFRRVIDDQAGFLPAWVDLGITEVLRGNFAQAREVLERALARDSRSAGAHFGLGLCALETGDYPRAINAFQHALEQNPEFPDAHNNLGVAYDRLGDLPRAVECLRRAIALHPGNVSAFCNLGDVLGRLGQRSDAQAVLQSALGLDPSSVTAHLGLARLAAGAADTRTALLHAQAAGLDRAVSEPALAVAVAVELETAGDRAQALEVLRAAARANPQNVDVHHATGELLHRLGKLSESLDCYERALAIDETRLRTWIHSGHALESLGAYARALENFEQGLRLDPANPQCLASIASCAFRLCDWDLCDRMVAVLRTSEPGIDALPAFLLLASDLEPAAIAGSQRRRARAIPWPAPPAVPQRRARSPGEPLRVAYVSPDFRTHPVAYAIAGVIEHHDRQRITPIAISLQAADYSPIGRRLRSTFDQFHDVSGRSDGDVVRLARELEIDIAIDLAGLTTGARPAIFAMRAAPLQVSYLGYPGSTGMPFIDLIIGDDVVIPVGDEPLYAETVARMSGCYLPFDDSRVLASEPVDRRSAGLPPSGFVFCAFTSPFKITRAVFAIWMELLRAIDGSVLWLRGMSPETVGNLQRAARAAAVDPARLRFAENLESMTAHLARLQLADLYLDTSPYNAHTTAAEALWAGVPLISCRGDYFAGRVGASLLAACGLERLICRDLDEYRTVALQIARNPALLQELRTTMRSARTSIAFDTRRYTRDIEDLLVRSHGLADNGHRA